VFLTEDFNSNENSEKRHKKAKSAFSKRGVSFTAIQNELGKMLNVDFDENLHFSY
jgi:hypothetical protein